MYCEHFGLKELPFGLTPNTEYFRNAQGHREAFNLLQVALAGGEGFIKVTGEVGTGKTMLCRQLLNTLADDYVSAYIPNPFFNPAGMYRALAAELGLEPGPRQSVDSLQSAINACLIELAANDKKVVLVIDEAQAIPPKTLEALRLISNLETETRKLVQIVLFGQPELDRTLAMPQFRQLLQRISFSYRLPPLDASGTRDYIQHRVSKAGRSGEPLFSDRAHQLLYRASGGVPRLVNILCHKALLCAYGKGDALIDRPHVVAAIRDTDGVTMPSWWSRWIAALLPLVAVLPLNGMPVPL